MVAEERGELAEQGKELARPDVRVEATARLRYADGEEAALELARRALLGHGRRGAARRRAHARGGARAAAARARATQLRGADARAVAGDARGHRERPADARRRAERAGARCPSR